MDKVEFFKPCNEAYREALAVHECFRTLGYLPEDIYLSVSRVYPTTVIFSILKQGEKEYIVMCGTVPTKNIGVVYKKWETMVEFWNSDKLSKEDREKMMTKSYVMVNKSDFVLGLVEKGFDVDRWKLN